MLFCFSGDYLLTALAIAKSIGLVPLGTDIKSGVARDAKDLRTSAHAYLSEGQIDEITAVCNVFARATPEDKLVIMRSLQRQGQTVAMTVRRTLKHSAQRLRLGLQPVLDESAPGTPLTDLVFCFVSCCCSFTARRVTV